MTIAERLSAQERLERLEQAVAAHFGGVYPCGQIADQLEAEQVLTEAAHRALGRT